MVLGTTIHRSGDGLAGTRWENAGAYTFTHFLATGRTMPGTISDYAALEWLTMVRAAVPRTVQPAIIHRILHMYIQVQAYQIYPIFAMVFTALATMTLLVMTMVLQETPLAGRLRIWGCTQLEWE